MSHRGCIALSIAILDTIVMTYGPLATHESKTVFLLLVLMAIAWSDGPTAVASLCVTSVMLVWPIRGGGMCIEVMLIIAIPLCSR